MNRSIVWLAAAAAIGGGPRTIAAAEPPVSFNNQIHPILRQWCQGCHQPATAGGKLILTTFAALTAGGDQGPAVAAGKPDDSLLVKYITGAEPKMPQGGPPLANGQIASIRLWIEQGAHDDTPAEHEAIDADHPPIYHSPPIISALAYSPDGQTLAVSGYHELLLHHADGSGLVARLVGTAHQIESVAFSPDGRTIAAVGGSPARFGEAQFWDAATHRLINAVQVSYDDLFGASFSPDGKRLAFGGADNSARVITVPDGTQVMKLDSHSDWVFGTTFAMDGKHLISAGRDEAIKLSEVDTGSFVDDINHHYDALKCLVRNPKADEVVCGGLDAIPRLYQVFRTVARTMNNEDHNLIREFEKQPGPISALAFSADGTRIAIGTDTDEVRVYRSGDGQRIATLKGNAGGVFALAFHPNGNQLAAGGFDGTVRVFTLPAGTLSKSFVPVPITP